MDRVGSAIWIDWASSSKIYSDSKWANRSIAYLFANVADENTVTLGVETSCARSEKFDRTRNPTRKFTRRRDLALQQRSYLWARFLYYSYRRFSSFQHDRWNGLQRLSSTRNERLCPFWKFAWIALTFRFGVRLGSVVPRFFVHDAQRSRVRSCPRLPYRILTVFLSCTLGWFPAQFSGQLLPSESSLRNISSPGGRFGCSISVIKHSMM